MEKIFAYRTAPQAKFKFIPSMMKQRKKTQGIWSQMYLSTECDDKTVFKTKTNLLMQNYKTQETFSRSNKTMRKGRMNRQMSQRSLKNLSTQREVKFHMLSVNNLRWQKWKQPENIIYTNKRNIALSLSKRTFTESVGKNKQQLQMDERSVTVRQHQIEKKIQQLKRFKKSIKEKKQVISVMNNLYQKQHKVVQKTFGTLKEEMEEMCDFYAHKKFDQIPLKKIKCQVD